MLSLYTCSELLISKECLTVCVGFLSLLLSAAAFGGLYYIQYPLTKILDAFLPLTVLVIALAFVISILLYIRSRYQHGNKLAAEGNTGK